MEVGAVKQAFNNEVIILKKSVNQARTQIIHRLTRKAHKVKNNENSSRILSAKAQRKAASAIKEVLILKKIKARDIAKFIITHEGDLEQHLKKNTVDMKKACARLLLHKALQGKYKSIKNQFKHVPITDLFMSRQERIKKKKELKEKSKQENQVTKQLEANMYDLTYEEYKEIIASQKTKNKAVISNELHKVNKEPEVHYLITPNKNNNVTDLVKKAPKKIKHGNSNEILKNSSKQQDKTVKRKLKKSSKLVKSHNELKINYENKHFKSEKSIYSADTLGIDPKLSKKLKTKDTKNKNNNFNEKIIQRKFKKNEQEPQKKEVKKVVDTFFKTATGDNYMSVVELRPPDEVKEIHKEGNRKTRRAAMFGYAAYVKPTLDKFGTVKESSNNKYNRNKSLNITSEKKSKPISLNNFGYISKHEPHEKNENNNFNHLIKTNVKSANAKSDSKNKTLHPSWEAKKLKSKIVPFEGKKIVFEEN